MTGLMASAMTTFSFVPQVYQTWREKSAKSLSTAMVTIFTLGTLLWFIYGIGIQSAAIISSSSITGLLQFCLIYLKINFSNKGEISI